MSTNLLFLRTLLFAAVVCILLPACSEPETEDFFVEGNCGACAPIIEAAALEVSGVKSARWDSASSMLSVTFRPGRADLDAIQVAVAGKGFATQFYPADSSARRNLPACCQEVIDHRLQPATPAHPLE
jgi:hypothetical protein